MTKKELIKVIEGDGRYYHVRIGSDDIVTGISIGEPSHYHSATNTGGRRVLGKATDFLAEYVR